MILLLQKLLLMPKNRTIAVLLASLGIVKPPLAGLHKFYLGQPLWGILYLILGFTPMPKIACVACAIEVIWYLVQDPDDFHSRFNLEATKPQPSKSIAESDIDPERVGAMIHALRELDQLRADGLMSEYEFEQKRRQLIDNIA